MVALRSKQPVEGQQESSPLLLVVAARSLQASVGPMAARRVALLLAVLPSSQDEEVRGPLSTVSSPLRRAVVQHMQQASMEPGPPLLVVLRSSRPVEEHVAAVSLPLLRFSWPVGERLATASSPLRRAIVQHMQASMKPGPPLLLVMVQRLLAAARPMVPLRPRLLVELAVVAMEVALVASKAVAGWPHQPVVVAVGRPQPEVVVVERPHQLVVVAVGRPQPEAVVVERPHQPVVVPLVACLLLSPNDAFCASSVADQVRPLGLVTACAFSAWPSAKPHGRLKYAHTTRRLSHRMCKLALLSAQQPVTSSAYPPKVARTKCKRDMGLCM